MNIKEFLFGEENSEEGQNGVNAFADGDDDGLVSGVEKLSQDEELSSYDEDEADSVGGSVAVQDTSDYDDSPEDEYREQMTVSLLTEETTVVGNIISKGHIDINGQVKGDIDAKGYVAVKGAVKGDVTGKKIGLYGSRVKGDLTAEVGIIADAESIIVGDIKTDSIISDGKIKGDIDAESMITFKSSAYYIGDVNTQTLTVEPGAVINGSVKMLVDGDSDAAFDD